MKRKLLQRVCYAFVLLFAMLHHTGVKAQNYYALKVTSESYFSLPATPLNGTDSIAQAYYASGPVEFPVYGKSINFNANSAIPSLGAYITRSGYLAVYEAPSYSHTMVFHGCYNAYHRRDATSAITVLYDGTVGNGILKIEWKNMGIDGAPDEDYVNFQVWFNQQNNTISYHYGKSHTSANFAAPIGMFRAPNDFTTITHASYITGDITDPQALSLSNPGSFAQINQVEGFPAEGTTYTFKQNATGLLTAADESNRISVYPNPAKNTLNIENLAEASGIKIIDMTGHEILSVPAGTSTLDISALSPGLYRAVSGSGSSAPFVKQ